MMVREFYPGNRFYGHGDILRKYSRFPYFLPLPVCIQHGWAMKPALHDARVDAPENWYWAPEIARKFKDKFSFINYRIVGSPFLYCLKNNHYKPEHFSHKNGSIAFPFHSTEKINLHLNVKKYCDMLNELPDEYKPVVVCLYHNDKKNGTDLLFLKYGFDTICNGDDPCDSIFLYNFIKNVSDKKFLLTNEWSTAMHYGSVMGCKVHLYGPKINMIKSEDENFSENFRESFGLFDKENRKYYSIPNSNIEKQYDIARRELGAEYLMSRIKMHLLLWRLAFTPNYLKCIKLFCTGGV